MIAASEPQEFVPSGRQQTLRHPSSSKQTTETELLLDQFEKVSLEEKSTERWILRKVALKPELNNEVPQAKETRFFNKSYPAAANKTQYSDFLMDDSQCSFKSADMSQKTHKRLSELSRQSFKKTSTHELSRLKNYEKQVTNDSDRMKGVSAFMEEELYVMNNTAVWSRGIINNYDGLDNGRKTLCSYTCPAPIKHALWCTFYCEHPTYDTDLFPSETCENTGVSVPALCIVDLYNLRVFTLKGEDFVTALPFQIDNVWSIKYGILLEKGIEDANATLPENRASLFSLAYPLDEICPVALNHGNNLTLFNNFNVKIVYTNDEYSLCMIYDTCTKQHSVYYVRKITHSERSDLMNKMNTTCPSAASMSHKLKARLSMLESLKDTKFLPVPSPIQLSNVPNVHSSRSQSSMAAMSRCQSPSVGVDSPWLQSLNQCTSVAGASQNRSYFDSSKVMSYINSVPNICLDHLWTEHTSSSDDACASKVFICDDLIGRWYLCYIVASKFQLTLVQIEFSERNIAFGMSTSVGAKDAAPIPACHLLAILEHNGNVTLYSGLTPVGKLHIAGTLVQHTPSPYVRRNLTQFNTPFPRRSSLLPHCKQSDPKFEDHLLSPVEPSASTARTNVLQLHFPLETNYSKAVLNGLRDPIENRLTLRYSDGTYYRITLPHLTSHPLIENCLVALKQCLSKDLLSMVLARWYACRNTLGMGDLDLEAEWNMFSALIFDLLGFEDEHSIDEEAPVTPSNNPKRQRHSISASNDDWTFLIQSKHEQKIGETFRNTLHLPGIEATAEHKPQASSTINTSSVLFGYVRAVHFALHLLYEDLKLNVLRATDLQYLARFLSKISSDLDLTAYVLHYWQDFPQICSMDCKSRSDSNETVPHIMQFVHDLLQHNNRSMYPYCTNINAKSSDIIHIIGASVQITAEHLLKPEFCCETVFETPPGGYSPAQQATYLLSTKGYTVRDLDTFPPGIYAIIYNVLWQCRLSPPLDLPTSAYYLLWREDLAAQALKRSCDSSKETTYNHGAIHAKQAESEQIDGMEDVDNSPLLKLRFPDDVRVLEARKMLQSSKHVPIILVQRPDVSDHDFIEEQEKHLYAICTRTMALATGRGMFTLRTSQPVITEPLQAPHLCLAGRAPPRGTTVELNHIDTPSNMNLWPLFHNGVASGLRITPDANNISNTWIIFNKPKASAEQQMEHAGFLMALGLNGHLRNLKVLDIYEYLVKLNEMTSIGVLLGLAAAHRGTSDSAMTKTLSIHVEALLPPTSMELDVHQNVQVAALLGIGLVYQGTSHRHIAEVLLSEIGRPPGPEMENCVDRESYSLAAGLSLGLVMLKKGSDALGLSDLNVPDTLHYYMVGGNRRALTGAQKDKYKVASFQIREGATVNLDVTAPGATIALGLMYLGSGNKAVANWMAPPETQYLLDFVRPDFLMYRILARSLILWNDIEASTEWIESHVPDTIRPYCMVKPQPNSGIDYEAMNQAYCNIVTGACFALGLKYAGSAHPPAFKTLLHFCHMFANLTVKSMSELAGKPTVETCLNVVLLSASMVMAGTGNLEIMRLVRMLRRRVGVASSAVVTYGSHLALHMSLGLLFLGGGRYTLNNSPANIAALICAFYPKFPTHSNDNRYHLQAFRHLYVLAVEPRIIIPRDVHSAKVCYAQLKIVRLNGEMVDLRGPGMIPDVNGLRSVAVKDERYWPVVFERGRNWELLLKILSTDGYVEVKQKPGCLSYLDDKQGYYGQLARTLTDASPWNPPSKSISSFTHDQSVKYFCDSYLTYQGASNEDKRLVQMLTKVTYDAVVQDKLVVLPIFTFLFKVVREMESCPVATNMWQLKLLLNTSLSNLLPNAMVAMVEQQIINTLEQFALQDTIRLYLSGQPIDTDAMKKLASFVIFYELPHKLQCPLNLFDMLNNFTVETVDALTTHVE